jgi:hypothetical protein
MRKKKWLLVGGVTIVVTMASVANAEDKKWQGGDLQGFSIGGNWFGGKPGSTDRGINDTTNRIKYDQVSGDQDYSYTALPYAIDKFWGDGESGLVFERYDAPTNGTSRALQVLHGLADTPPNPNDHEIFIGRREALWIGDGFIPTGGSAPSTAADIIGYSVTADGSGDTSDWAMMSVTQTLGAGAYDLKKTRLGVGYALEQLAPKTNWEFRLYPFFDQVEPLAFGNAVIDSDRSVHGTGVSEWSLTDSRVYARRAEDLDNWRVEPAEFVSPCKGRSKPRQMNPYARRTVDLDRLT